MNQATNAHPIPQDGSSPMRLPAPVQAAPKKILLLKLAAAGDLVIASPFFESLRKHFPHAEISLLVGRSCSRIMQNNPSVDRMIVANDEAIYQGNLWRKTAEFFQDRRSIEKTKIRSRFRDAPIFSI
jgi:hypothetical protein